MANLAVGAGVPVRLGMDKTFQDGVRPKPGGRLIVPNGEIEASASCG
jgi:hypothetical protein